MDKITRTLLLYSKLLKGETVNKTVFCLETDSLPRSFDRDIEDVRLFLSETYDHRELVYDRNAKQYYLTEQPTPPLDATEISLILQLFHDTRILSQSEFLRFTENLCENVRKNQNIKVFAENLKANYVKPPHNRSILKIHSDLQKVIEEKWLICLRYFPENEQEEKIEIIPCAIKFQDNQLFLAAIPINDEKSVLYRVDWIDSFLIRRDLTQDEIDKFSKFQ